MAIKVVLITSMLWLSVGILYIYLTELTDLSWEKMMVAPDKSSTTADDMIMIDPIKAPPRFFHNQPGWAYKYKFMEQADAIPDDKRICYVHVGKTAGSTLACYFGFDYGQCETGEDMTSSLYRPKHYNKTLEEETVRAMVPPGLLPRYTTSMIHRKYDSCVEDLPMSMYLFVVRNPFTRMQSWFEYERPNNYTTNYDGWEYKNILKPLFVDCKFQTLNDLGGKTGLGAKNNTLCSRRAFRAITGITGYIDHNKYNYEYYYKKAIEDHQTDIDQRHEKNPRQQPRIVVIRTEHLESDWNSIEGPILQSAQTLPSDFTFTHKNRSPKRKEDLYFDTSSKQNLCQALCREIQYYKQILIEAENLNKKDFIDSMTELAMDCPVETNKDTC